MKIFTLFISFFSTRKFFWSLIKIINKIKPHSIESIFVIYPGNSKYLSYYLYDWVAKWLGWRILLIGIKKQHGSWGLVFGLPIGEAELTSEDNSLKLTKMTADIRKLAAKSGVSYINYSGILPSVLSRRGLPNSQSGTQAIISQVVVSGFFQMVDEHNIELDRSVIYVLGGKGFIGREVSKQLLDKGVDIVVVEKENQKEFKTIVENNNDKNHIFINVARKGTFEQYAPLLNNLDCYLLNEVYPEPAFDSIQSLKGAYHIKGVKAFVFPSLPFGYSAALPCCALIAKSEEPEYDVVLQNLMIKRVPRKKKKLNLKILIYKKFQFSKKLRDQTKLNE